MKLFIPSCVMEAVEGVLVDVGAVDVSALDAVHGEV